jgi:hypothetical protein
MLLSKHSHKIKKHNKKIGIRNVIIICFIFDRQDFRKLTALQRVFGFVCLALVS